MNVQARSVSRPACVRRNSERNACTSSASLPTSQSMRSVSGRNPTVEYVPRTSTRPSNVLYRFSTSCTTSASASAERSRNPSRARNAG